MNPASENLNARVPLTAAGRRFDQVLAELFPEFSRSRLSTWIKAGEARLDGVATTPRHIVRGDEAVTLIVRPTQEVALAPEPIELDIRYSDTDVLVINKPVGLIVHPGAGNPAGTLQNALLHLDASLAEVPRAGIVHRLDKDTSGLMVVARNLRAHTALVEQLQARSVHRQYEAVVVGLLIAGGTIDAPIDRHPRDRLRQAVVEGGKEAITQYRVTERFRGHSLLQLNLHTGRTHQIRVHMTHLQHPLVGDALYGGGLKLPRGATDALKAALSGFKRQALHAEQLAFIHPRTGESVDVKAERPADMQALLAALRTDQVAAAAAARQRD
jgi:23S rRNA pseudouridine1911/1915/1917 synthase